MASIAGPFKMTLLSFQLPSVTFHLYRNPLLSQELSGLLGKGDVNIDARTHLESCGCGQPRNDLKMPVIVILLLILDGSRVDDVIVIGVVELCIELQQGRF